MLFKNTERRERGQGCVSRCPLAEARCEPTPRRSLAASLQYRGGAAQFGGHRAELRSRGGDDMGYIIAWLLGVPVTLLVLFWLFFGG
jgi:hypothetical protein